jgi:hypothetical protein
MNRDERFEDRLGQVPQRPIPIAWRNEILNAAAARQPMSAPAHSSLRAALAAMLWPHPRAWAGLGAAWVLIFLLSLAGRDPAPTEIARHAPPPSLELRELLRQQGKLFAELTSSLDASARASARPVGEPRSQRRQDWRNA